MVVSVGLYACVNDRRTFLFLFARHCCWGSSSTVRKTQNCSTSTTSPIRTSAVRCCCRRRHAFHQLAGWSIHGVWRGCHCGNHRGCHFEAATSHHTAARQEQQPAVAEQACERLGNVRVREKTTPWCVCLTWLHPLFSCVRARVCVSGPSSWQRSLLYVSAEASLAKSSRCGTWTTRWRRSRFVKAQCAHASRAHATLLVLWPCRTHTFMHTARHFGQHPVECRS